MRVEALFTFFLFVPFFSCSRTDDARATTKKPSPERATIAHTRPAAAIKAFDFDIVQRTCAMYVAMHSAAFNAPVSFDRTIDDDLVHWNKCPSGNMVACATASSTTAPANGIPWPY